jgi:hypothetical protein
VSSPLKLVPNADGPRLVPPDGPRERNWLPLAIAAGIVLLIAAAAVFLLEHGRSAKGVTPISAQPDAYAASLPVTNLAMSESGNLAGGKLTYLDGHIANLGNRTVTGVTVQVLFRDMAHEVTQNETQPLRFIRIRTPEVDLEPVSAEPLKPGAEQDFRLIFDAVSPDWDGAYPELRVLHVETK